MTYFRQMMVAMAIWFVATSGQSQASDPLAEAYYEQAVRFQVTQEVRAQATNYFAERHLPHADAIRIDVAPTLEVEGDAPWLAQLDIRINLPASWDPAAIDIPGLQQTILATYAEQGFEVDTNRRSGDVPFASVFIDFYTAEREPAAAFPWNAALLRLLGVSIVIWFSVWLLMFVVRRRRRLSFSQRAAPSVLLSKPLETLTAEDLLVARDDELEALFAKLPFEDALKLLSGLPAEARGRILQHLKIHAAIRRSIEDQLLSP